MKTISYNEITLKISKKKKFEIGFSKIKRFIPLYIIFLPVLIYYLIFTYIPILGVSIAFKEYNLALGIFNSPWVGLKHFQSFITNGDFWNVFSNTFILAGLRIIFGFPAPIIFAILLYELRFTRFKRIIQTVSYLPHFISWVVVYGLLYNLFASDGLINQINAMFGQPASNILGSELHFRALFVGSAIWKEVGWGAIVYLAALTTVDTELIEASYIDGANRFQRLIFITLPSIRSIISIMLILSLGGILNVSFEQILVMYNPGVSNIADVIDYYIYRTGLQQINNFSYATAVGLFRSVIALAIVLLTNWSAKKIEKEGGIW